MNTFEDFLRSCLNQGHSQVKLVPRIDADGKVAFYAVGQCGIASSETFDSSVGGNIIRGPEEVAEATPFVDPFTEEELTAFIAYQKVAVEATKVADAFVAVPGEDVIVSRAEDKE